MKAKTLLHRCSNHPIAGSLLGLALACAVVSPASADLTHRYSFTADASDSVGGANGTPQNNVVFDGNGSAQFGGLSPSGPNCDYIQLPPGLISNYTSVTFEFWVDVGANGTWEEIYAFGNQTAGGAGANMVMFCPHSGSSPNDFRMSYAQAAPGYNDEYVNNGVGILDNLGPVSVACVYDPPNNTMSLYTNGVLVRFISPVTARFSLTNVYNVNSWLGRSMYNGDSSYAGSIDEFRIYNSALGPLQVAVDNAAGPDTVVTNIAVNSIVWNVSTNMPVGSRQDTTVTFNTAKYGTYTLPGSTEATYSSANTNVAVVTKTGRIFATGVGTTTVSASYNGTVTSIQLIVNNPALVNRYSFTTDASDSVGGANGTLQGSATISGGAVVLPGGVTSNDPTVSYVNLPPNLVMNLTAITIETWVTDLGSPNWARIWDLGNSAGGQGVSNGGSLYMFLSLPSGNSDLLGTVHISDRAGGDQPIEWAGGRPPVGKEAHVVWTSDSANHIGRLYVNGALVAVNNNMTLTPADIGTSVNDWLGRSQYNDPAFNGSIDEFRIWNGALSPFQVAINAAAGPDVVGPSDPGTLAAAHLTVGASMSEGDQQQTTLFADFASVSNVNVTTLGSTFTSSDPTVLTVSSNGVVRAVGVGTATVTGTYNGKSDTKTIAVAAPQVALTHRWSFNETSGTTVADSIGGATGNLVGGANLFNNAVSLDGVSGYVQLPGHLIDGDSRVTVETWVTVDPSSLSTANGRLFTFGSAPGANEIGLTAVDGGNNTTTLFDGPPNLSFTRGGSLGTGTELQVVTEYNPPAGTIELYINGVWQNGVTNLAFSLASITNTLSLLGVSLDTNNYTAVTFDEMRIYNGALDLAAIRTDLAAGPDNLVTNAGAATSVTLKVDPIMPVGSRQLPHTYASYASVTNVDLTQTAAVGYSSSDSSVVSVTADGRLQAVGLGTATITATVGAKTATATVNVYPKQTMLAHRYSFTTDASDSVGAQDGTIFGTATISGNAAVLIGSGTDKNSYIDLPPGLVSSLDSVTMEAWVSLPSPVGTWSRLFDFGSQNTGGNGVNYVFLSPHTGTPSLRSVLSDGSEASADTIPPLDGFTGQIVVVFDPTTDTQAIYTNGVLAVSAGLGGKKLSGVNDLHCWLGRSMYAGDSGLSGSIDEFRIYAGAFTPAQVTADFNAGANTVVLPPPTPGASNPKLSASVSGGNIVISWSPSGGTLQSSPTLGTGATWTAVGSANPATVQMTGNALFFRVSK